MMMMTATAKPLRQWRTERFMSVRELAAAAGVSTRTVQDAEAGRPPRFVTMRKLAAALDVEPAQVDEFRAAADVWAGRAGKRPEVLGYS